MPEVPANSNPIAALPLQGRTVVVTRAADQAAGLAEPLAALGAEVVLMPVIRIAPPADWAATDRALESLGSYDWLILTSTNGVDAFLGRLTSSGRSVADLEPLRIAVVGRATADHLRAVGLEPDIVPGSFRAEAVVEALGAIGPAGGSRVLLARAEEAREVLPADLGKFGFEVDVVPVYRLDTAPADPAVTSRFASGGVDVVTFASGGTARRFVEALAAGGLDPLRTLDPVTVASIGPVTTEGLLELGIPVDVEAPEATAGSLAAAIAERYSGVAG